MKAGKRNHKIAIQSVTSVQDAKGLKTRTFATIWEPWANIVSTSGGETMDRRRLQVAGEVSHVVTINWRAGVTRDHRILWGSRKLEILSVLDPENDRVELVLYCKEVV